MSTITTTEIERDPAGWLRRVEAGESLVVVRDGHAVAEIKPSDRPALEPRPAGLSKGLFTVPDDFDDPLPDDVLDGFDNPS